MHSAITLAVPTGRLEDALRRLKAHREQLQPAIAPPAPKAPPAPSTPPTPPGVAHSAAQAAQTLAAAPAATPAADWPFPGERESRAAPQLHDHWPEPDSARAEQMAEALAFDAPAYYFTPKNRGMFGQYRTEQAARGRAIVAAVLAGGAARARGASLSRLALVRILLVNLVESGAIWVRFNVACDLAGVALPDELREPKHPSHEPRSTHGDRMKWLWQLPAEDAEALCAVLAASQEGDTSGDAATPLSLMPEFVLEDLRVDARRVAEHAQASVDEILRLAALKHAPPAPAPKKAKAATGKADQS